MTKPPRRDGHRRLRPRTSPVSSFHILRFAGLETSTGMCGVHSGDNDAHADVVFVIITSSSTRLQFPQPGDFVIDDWRTVGLLLPSVVRTARLLVLEQREIGRVSATSRRQTFAVLTPRCAWCLACSGAHHRVLLKNMEQIWFITGSSRGLGRALVRAALDAGDRVAATARQPAQLDDLVADHGERLHNIALDVTDGQAARHAISEAHRRFGRLDVIVNNAGYANVSPIESADDDDFRAQFETNFWGVYNVSKAAIPFLREQGGGIVIQISSMGGRVGG